MYRAFFCAATVRVSAALLGDRKRAFHERLDLSDLIQYPTAFVARGFLFTHRESIYTFQHDVKEKRQREKK